MIIIVYLKDNWNFILPKGKIKGEDKPKKASQNKYTISTLIKKKIKETLLHSQQDLQKSEDNRPSP